MVSRAARALIVGCCLFSAATMVAASVRADPGWSGRPPPAPNFGEQRTIIKNPKRENRVEVAEGLVERAARFEADAEDSLGNDLDMLLAMSAQRQLQHNNNNQGETLESRESLRFSLREMARGEHREQRPLRAKGTRDSALDDIVIEPEELRRMSALLTGGVKDNKGRRDAGDGAGSEVSSAQAGDVTASASPPEQVSPVEMLRRENRFLRIQLKQQAQQQQTHSPHVQHEGDSLSDDYGSLGLPAYGAAPFGSNHAMNMLDQQRRRSSHDHTPPLSSLLHSRTHDGYHAHSSHKRRRTDASALSDAGANAS